MTDLTNVDWFEMYRELKRRGFAVIAFSSDELRGCDPEEGAGRIASSVGGLSRMREP
jgi:hypothetical protein